MTEIPFEDFVPNWRSTETEEEEQTERDKERMRSKALALVGMVKQMAPAGRAMSRPRKE